MRKDRCYREATLVLFSKGQGIQAINELSWKVNFW